MHFWSWLKENEDGSWDWELILVLKEDLTVKKQNYFIVTFVRSKRTLKDWKLASFFPLWHRRFHCLNSHLIETKEMC